MPQEFRIVRCYHCETFQVDIVKKAKQWSCKMCGEKQSLKKVYFLGAAKDCRKHVQAFNEKRLTEKDEVQNARKQICEKPLEDSYHLEENHAPKVSKWAEFLNDENKSEDEQVEEGQFTFESLDKKRNKKGKFNFTQANKHSKNETWREAKSMKDSKLSKFDDGVSDNEESFTPVQNPVLKRVKIDNECDTFTKSHSFSKSYKLHPETNLKTEKHLFNKKPESTFTNSKTNSGKVSKWQDFVAENDSESENETFEQNIKPPLYVNENNRKSESKLTNNKTSTGKVSKWQDFVADSDSESETTQFEKNRNPPLFIKKNNRKPESKFSNSKTDTGKVSKWQDYVAESDSESETEMCEQNIKLLHHINENSRKPESEFTNNETSLEKVSKWKDFVAENDSESETETFEKNKMNEGNIKTSLSVKPELNLHFNSVFASTDVDLDQLLEF